MTVELTKVVNPPSAPISHKAIIKRNQGPAPISRALGEPRETVKGWSKNDSIPADRWLAFVGNGLATLEELAAYAAYRSSAEGA